MQGLSSHLTSFDYGVLGLLAFGFVIGFFRGLPKQFIIVLIWLVAFIIAGFVADQFSDLLLPYIEDELFASLLLFVVTFFVVLLACSLVNLIICAFLKSSGKPFSSRLLGGVFGIIQAGLAVLFILFLLSNLPGEKIKWLDHSMTMHYTQPILNWMQKTMLSLKDSKSAHNLADMAHGQSVIMPK